MIPQLYNLLRNVQVTVSPFRCVLRALHLGSMYKWLLLAGLTSAPMWATMTFVPGGFANTEADSNGISPLSVGSFYLDHGSAGSGRMQILFDASEFTGLGGPISISEIAFRDDSEDTTLSFTATLGDIQVYLDTTSQTINGISSTFANNTNNEQLVYSGSITFNIPAESSTPRCFCYTIDFSTPYTYDPTQGNLLLDILIITGNDPNTSSLPTLDYSRSSSAMAVAVDYSSSADTTGAAGSDQGWPTQFTYDLATPEPSTWVLMLTGGAALGLWRRRRS